MLAGDHLVGGGDDGLAPSPSSSSAEVQVDLRGGALDLRQRADELARHALAGDLEVLQRALRLRAPQAVGGDFDVAESVRSMRTLAMRRFICMIHAACLPTY